MVLVLVWGQICTGVVGEVVAVAHNCLGKSDESEKIYVVEGLQAHCRCVAKEW